MLIAAATAVVVGGTVVAVAASSGTGTPPPPASLADALHQALTAPQADGVTARVTFTNNLLPSGALFGNAGSPLLSGASGRLWLTNDGRGRIELQSDSGDAQIVWSPTQVTVYDASSNTVYKLALPQSSDQSGTKTHTPPTLAEVSDFLTKLAQHVDVSGATPTVVANQPAYEASLSPKEAGSLLGSVKLAWDAAQGVPLQAGLYATGSTSPVLQLAVKDISYGAVANSDVDIAPPADAKVVDLGTASPSHDNGATSKPVTGLDAVEAGAGFGVVAPDSIAGRARTKALLVGHRVVLVYGDNPGAIVVVEHEAGSGQTPKMLDALPKVDVNGVTGHELTTDLGTAITWQANGVGYVLLGSVPAATAESAAQDVK
jgi:outer membrane lipoprotein-sorting protein